jgi:hypothetical protein
MGLDNLCASERVAANWTAAHFGEFLYYQDGCGRLQIFDGSPQNDGRLAGKSPRPRCEYTLAFNPDGTVATFQRGERTIALATFDSDRNVSSGTRLVLPRTIKPADPAGIRLELSRLFDAVPRALSPSRMSALPLAPGDIPESLTAATGGIDNAPARTPREVLLPVWQRQERPT